ncbi:MAG: hypothetical protein IJR06_00535 [Paludibacteraceae bacterium]|nr:hypothetical protein [Paludibacteraceae bacterium]
MCAKFQGSGKPTQKAQTATKPTLYADLSDITPQRYTHTRETFIAALFCFELNLPDSETSEQERKQTPYFVQI